MKSYREAWVRGMREYLTTRRPLPRDRSRWPPPNGEPEIQIKNLKYLSSFVIMKIKKFGWNMFSSSKQGRSEVWVRPWRDWNVALLALFLRPPIKTLKGGGGVQTKFVPLPQCKSAPLYLKSATYVPFFDLRPWRPPLAPCPRYGPGSKVCGCSIFASGGSVN
jgi:hypothetical protein